MNPTFPTIPVDPNQLVAQLAFQSKYIQPTTGGPVANAIAVSLSNRPAVSLSNSFALAPDPCAGPKTLIYNNHQASKSIYKASR